MKRVTPQPILPREVGDNWVSALIKLLREYSDSINQAADLRLWEFVTVTAAYTAGENDHVIVVKPGAALALTIPAASVMRNKRVVVKRGNNTTHTITVTPVTGNIDTAANITLTTAFQAREFFSDGVDWWTV